MWMPISSPGLLHTWFWFNETCHLHNDLRLFSMTLSSIWWHMYYHSQHFSMPVLFSGWQTKYIVSIISSGFFLQIVSFLAYSLLYPVCFPWPVSSFGWLALRGPQWLPLFVYCRMWYSYQATLSKRKALNISSSVLKLHKNNKHQKNQHLFFAFCVLGLQKVTHTQSVIFNINHIWQLLKFSLTSSLSCMLKITLQLYRYTSTQ